VKKFKYVFIVTLLLLFSCSSDNENNGIVNPCSIGGQGFSFSENCNECGDATFFDDSLLVAELVTGGVNGDYYHFYSIPPADFIEFYSYGVPTGSTTSLNANSGHSSGSYLYIDGQGVLVNSDLVVTTIQGGINVGDNVVIEITYLITVDGETYTFQATFCVTLDEIIPINSNCTTTAIEYRINNTTTNHIENVVTAEIWDVSNYPLITKNVYDIWTDDGTGFNFHSSASNTGDVSNHVPDWQTTEGSNLIIGGDTVNVLNVQITQQAGAVGDLVTIEFSGTLNNGDNIVGTICTIIDLYHP